MKQIATLLTSLIIAFAALAGNPGDKVGVSFENTVFDFGTVKASDGPVKHTFVFHNNGAGAVAITKASASCGCTRPDYNRRPVAAGKDGKITVSLSTAEQRGEINKEVTVRMRNADKKTETIVLRLVGAVVPGK